MSDDVIQQYEQRLAQIEAQLAAERRRIVELEAQLADAEQAARAEASARRDYMQRLEETERELAAALAALGGGCEAVGVTAPQDAGVRG